MVDEPVQQRTGEPFRGEDLGPLVQRKIGGRYDGASVVVPGEGLERQFGSGSRKWCEALFVDDERVRPSQLLLETEPPSFVPDLHQFVDQTRGARGHSP